MINTIGLIEFRSIAKGIEAADYMIKSSQVEIVFSKTVCPGKYIILICGDVSSVKEAIEKGLTISQKDVIDKLILPSIHSGLIEAIKGKSICSNFNSIGIMEISNIALGIIAADTACKNGNITLVKLILGMGIGGKSYFIISGDVSSVKSSLDAAEGEIDSKKIIAKVVIPSPDKEIVKNLV